MSLNFAPYQDHSPETNRILHSPSPPRLSSLSPPALRTPPQTTPQSSLSNIPRPAPADPWSDLESGGRRDGLLDEFATTLPMRLDYEACLAYLLMPPAGGVLLLLVEHKSDYVRFHAWQSSLLFTAIFVLHLLLSWSTFMSWLLLGGDLGLVGYLTYRAYIDADMLDRCEVPFFGELASKILDDE